MNTAYTLLEGNGMDVEKGPQKHLPPQGTRQLQAIWGRGGLRGETSATARHLPSRLLEPRAVVKSLHVNFEDLNQNVGKSLAQGQGQARSAPVWGRPWGKPVRAEDERMRRTQGVKGGPAGTSLFVKMEQSFSESLKPFWFFLIFFFFFCFCFYCVFLGKFLFIPIFEPAPNCLFPSLLVEPYAASSFPFKTLYFIHV